MPLPHQWKWKLDRWRERLTAPGGIFGPDPPKEQRPRLCPACGTLVGATAEKCHECGASMTYSLAAASRRLAQMIPVETPVSYAILGLNFLLFAVCMAASLQGQEEFSLFGGIRGEVLLRLGARQSYLLFQGEWWRLVMPIFLHGGLLHIGMNTMALIGLGPALEEVYGSAKYLFLYVATGVLSFVVSTAWNIFFHGGQGLSIGASGAIMGLVGLGLAITSKRGGAYARAIRSQLTRSVIVVFVIGIIFPFMDNGAHLGGFVAGYALGKIFADRQPMNATERNRAYALGWLAGLVVVASFAAVIARYLAQRGT